MSLFSKDSMVKNRPLFDEIDLLEKGVRMFTGPFWRNEKVAATLTASAFSNHSNSAKNHSSRLGWLSHNVKWRVRLDVRAQSRPWRQGTLGQSSDLGAYVCPREADGRINIVRSHPVKGRRIVAAGSCEADFSEFEGSSQIADFQLDTLRTATLREFGALNPWPARGL